MDSKENLYNQLDELVAQYPNKNFAFIGEIGAGKSTCAEYLDTKYGFKQLSYASNVKRFAKMILGRDIDKGIDRPLLQQIGQYLKIPYFNLSDEQQLTIDKWVESSEDFRKEYNRLVYTYKIHKPTFYINLLKDCIGNFSYTIQDMRFLIEAETEKECGTIIVLLKTKSAKERVIERDGLYDDNWNKDSSEQEWSKIACDYVIEN
jgi:dephospho-CoA kinase